MATLSAPDAPYNPYRPNSGSSTSPLKHMTLVDAHGYSPSHGASSARDSAPYEAAEFQFQQMSRDDAALKHRIRTLKLISRTVATLLSIGALIPVVLTLHKFLSTKDTFKDVQQNGQTINRNAWHKDSKTWPTIMYVVVAALSLVLNAVVMVSYLLGVSKANRAAKVATTFSWIVILGNLGVWIAAAVLYRQQKNLNGNSNDLWGWTCSSSAKEIQKVFKDQVNFNRYCDTQSVAWYFGLAQAGAAIISVITYILALRRMRSKKKMDKKYASSRRSYEPL